MGESCVTFAHKVNPKDELALSALIRAMDEMGSYAVARFVVGNGKDPQLLLLMPSTEPGNMCLYDVPLPFAEDVRQYQFPPLDKVVTVSGGVLTEHRRMLPNETLRQAMSDYVDAMDISGFPLDGEG